MHGEFFENLFSQKIGAYKNNLVFHFFLFFLFLFFFHATIDNKKNRK